VGGFILKQGNKKKTAAKTNARERAGGAIYGSGFLSLSATFYLAPRMSMGTMTVLTSM